MRALLGAVEWSNGIEEAWARVASFVPKFFGFLVILVIGAAVAKLIAMAVDRILERTGFDHAVERGGVRRALANSRYDASDLVSKVVFYGLMLFVLQLAFGVFGANAVSDLITGVIAFLPKLVVAIVVVVVASAIAAAVKDIVANTLSGVSYGQTLATTASVCILGLGGFMALSQLGIAPAIVNAAFYAILAVIAGSAIVAIGGGGIQPMRARWERALQRWDEESPRLRRRLDEARAEREAQRAIDQRALDLRDQTVVADPSAVDQTTEMPVRGGGDVMSDTTQERIRAGIRSDPTLP